MVRRAGLVVNRAAVADIGDSRYSAAILAVLRLAVCKGHSLVIHRGRGGGDLRRLRAAAIGQCSVLCHADTRKGCRVNGVFHARGSAAQGDAGGVGSGVGGCGIQGFAALFVNDVRIRHAVNAAGNRGLGAAAAAVDIQSRCIDRQRGGLFSGMPAVAVAAGCRDDSAARLIAPIVDVVVGADGRGLAGGRGVVVGVARDALIEHVLGAHRQAGEGRARLPVCAILAVFAVRDRRQRNAVDGRAGLRRRGGGRLIGLVDRHSHIHVGRGVVVIISGEVCLEGRRRGNDISHALCVV